MTPLGRVEWSADGMTDSADSYLDELVAGLWALSSSEPGDRRDEAS